MPKIEYQCSRCAKRFERLVFLGDEETPPKCPDCGSGEVKKSAGADPLFGGIASFSELARDRN